MSTNKSNVIIGSKAVRKMLDGIKTATNAVRISYGPSGVNSVIEQEFYPYHVIANDCETILQSVHVEDKYEKIGLDILKELSTKAHKDSGDGRKTTCIIGDEIITSGYKLNVSGVALKRDLDELIPVIEQNIDEQKKTITEEDVYKVATIAGESEELGKIIGDIYVKIGKDGIIVPESSGTPETTTEYVEGIRFNDTGYLSPYMAHDEEARKEGKKETKAIYKNPLILVTKRKIERDSDIEALLETSIKNNRPLVIFTDDMDSGVASRIIAAHKGKVGKFLIIRAPVLWKNYIFEDFAKVTGSTIIEDASGITYKTLKFDHLGTCEKITVDSDETTIVGGSDITDHLKYLEDKNDNDSKLRLSWLKTKTCILRLGANNESELSYKRLKCYDAINSSKLALKDGIVAGAGVALLNAADALPKGVAGKILAEALREPYKQIIVNYGVEYISGMHTDNYRLKSTYGYDAKRGKVVDMFEEGIVDAASVVKNAIRNAISLASTVLTGRIVIKIPERSAEQIASEALKGKGLRF